jgi:NACHT domain
MEIHHCYIALILSCIDASRRSSPAGTPPRGLFAAAPFQNWSRGDVLALAGIIASFVIAAIPPTRRALLRWWQTVLLRLGFPRHAYAEWFIRTWGVYENPYLDDTENLDLNNTNVPLSFRSDEAGLEILTIAAAVLADDAAGNLIIDGSPGSGKSTLLKSFGVAVLQESRALKLHRPAVPFLIQLRKLVRDEHDQIDISEYLVNEILVSAIGMKLKHAWKFFNYALKKDQVIVMLDGLDEVGKDNYQAVQEAVYGFVKDHRPECQSYRARVIVTCRKQNFLNIRDEWIPAIANRVCSLAPLRNSEIFSYLKKLRSKFKNPSGPESFLQALRISGTLDLHRAPLILAMSVGLYAKKDYFEIPSSIATLYKTMIQEMLDRHRFKRDPGGGVLKFRMSDKYRFLREFSFRSARTTNAGFDEFTKAEIVDFADKLAKDLDAVSEHNEFVEEIIQRSGLLADVGESGRYIFAHRSIQEFLAAEEAKLTDDETFLLAEAENPEWRQVIQFYTASLEQRKVNTFLAQLSQHNQELAGYCLASAKSSDNVAALVLGALNSHDGVGLSALAAATMSPRISVQKMAIDLLRRALSSPDSPVSALNGQVDVMLPLLNSLAGTNAAEIAGLVPQLIKHIPDDPRLTEPLWRCLTAPGIEAQPASCALVERLLMIATSPDGFEDLARQEPYTRDFLAAYTDAAYPFRNGLDPSHNLVTLLAWAEYSKVVPVGLNRFFEAKRAGCLDKIETDRKRTISFSLFRPGLIFSVAYSIAALTGAIAVASAHSIGAMTPLRSWTWALIVGVAASPLAAYLLTDQIGVRLPDQSRAKRILGSDEHPRDNSHAIEFAVSRAPEWLSGPIGLLAVIFLPVAVAVACLPLLNHSFVLYVAVAVVGGILYGAPRLGPFSRARRYYLYRPSGYIDIYEDPRSRHWIVRSEAVSAAKNR